MRIIPHSLSHEIYVIHKDWEGVCVIENEMLFRKNQTDEKGTFQISEHPLSIPLSIQLCIQWERWNEEVYYQVGNQYILNTLYDLQYRIIHLHDEDVETVIVLQLTTSTYYDWNVPTIQGQYHLKNKLLRLSRTDSSDSSHPELWIEKEKHHFERKKLLPILLSKSSTQKTEYFLDEKEKTFYQSLDKNYLGSYFFQNQLIYLHWNHGKIEEYQTQEYSFSREFKTNIHYRIPCPIILHSRILFSDIVLSQNRLFMTSVCYLERPWNLDALRIQTTPSYQKCIIHEHHHFESSLLFLFEFGENLLSVDIEITYEEDGTSSPPYYEKRKIISSSVPSYTYSCMTLFKEDYTLLKKWISHYSEKGIEYFHLYYNGKITDSFQKNIHELKLFEYPVTIQITEWDYEYWTFYEEGQKKHHHAQTMAMNHALHQLKNTSTYLLYVDLDEYIQGDTIPALVQRDPHIDVFVFHNRFCKMTNENVSYQDFYSLYDPEKIILGNYWDKMREKLLIHLEHIEVMGVHEVYTNYSSKEIQFKKSGEFYHFINFKEKCREHLMTQYVLE